MSFRSWCRRWFIKAGSQVSAVVTNKAAKDGDADAQYAMGLLCSVEGSERHDPQAAADWFQRSSAQGHVQAKVRLAQILSTGEGVSPNREAALELLRSAAKSGSAEAQFELGLSCHRSSVDHREGHHAQSRIEAYSWLKLSASQGYRGAVAACEMLSLTMSLQEVQAAIAMADTFTPLAPHLAERKLAVA